MKSGSTFSVKRRQLEHAVMTCTNLVSESSWVDLKLISHLSGTYFFHVLEMYPRYTLVLSQVGSLCRQEGRSHRARKRPCKRKPDYCVAWQIHLSYVDLRFCFLALRAVSLSLLFSFSYTYANVISILENMPIRGTIFGTSAFSMSKFTFPFSFRSQDSHCTGVTARCAVSISPYQWLSDYCLL